MKATDRAHLRELNKSPMIKWPIKEAVTTTAHKISLIVQVQLGGVDLPNKKDFNRRQYLVDQSLVFDRIQRLVRCVTDCKTFDNDAVATQNALELSRSIAAQSWEHLPTQLRQIPNIGAAAVRKLSAAGLTTVDKLLNADSAAIERAMSRNPPFGHAILESLKDFPRLSLKAEVIGRTTKAGKLPEVKIRAWMGLLKKSSPYWRRELITLTFMAGVSNGHLAHMWKGSLKKLEKGCDIYFTAELQNFSDAVSCFVACDELVGTVKSVILNHNLPESVFPKVPPMVQRSPAKVVQSVEGDDSDYDEGFDWDDVAGSDLLVVPDKTPKLHAQAGKAQGRPNDALRFIKDEFLDIDELETTQLTGANIKPLPEPEQMANGKWMCNHACRGGQKLKNGITCKHKCCRDGLDKPRKLATGKKAKPHDEKMNARCVKDETKTHGPGKPIAFGILSQKDIDNIASVGTVEVLDLSQVLSPVPYESIAPRDYRKLNTLHNQTGSGKHVSTLRNIKPIVSYTSSTQPYVSYMQSATSQMLASGSKGNSSMGQLAMNDKGMNEPTGSDSDLPSPSRLDECISSSTRKSMILQIPHSGFMNEEQGSSDAAFRTDKDNDLSVEFNNHADHGIDSSDAMYRTDILGADNACFGTPIEPSTRLEAGNTPKRKLPEEDYFDGGGPFKTRKEIGDVFLNSPHGLSTEDTEAALTTSSSKDQAQPPPKPRPEWLNDFDPQFIALFDYVEFVD